MKLDRLPEHGLVFLCPPSLEDVVAERAEQQGIDYLVADMVPPGSVYALNCDSFRADFLDG